MNVKRFTGRTSREAMQKVREAFGDEAVVLSTKPAPEGGIEIMAMGADGIAAIENMPVERHEPAARPPVAARVQQAAAQPAQQESKVDKQVARNSVASLASSVQDDVRQLAMSTLSFQEYVRERMLKRRQAAIKSRMEPEMAQSPEEQLAQRVIPTARAAASLMSSPDVDTSLDLSAPSLRLIKGQGGQSQRDAALQDEMDRAPVHALPGPGGRTGRRCRVCPARTDATPPGRLERPGRADHGLHGRPHAGAGRGPWRGGRRSRP